MIASKLLHNCSLEPLGFGWIGKHTSIEARFVGTADDDDIEDSFLFFAGVCAKELGIFGIAISCFIAGAGTSGGIDSLSSRVAFDDASGFSEPDFSLFLDWFFE